LRNSCFSLYSEKQAGRGFGTPRVENFGTRPKFCKSLMLFQHHFKTSECRVRDSRVGRQTDLSRGGVVGGLSSLKAGRRHHSRKWRMGNGGHGSQRKCAIKLVMHARSTWLGSSMARTHARLGHIPCGHFPLPAGWFFDCHLSWPILTPVLWTSMCLSFLTSAPAC